MILNEKITHQSYSPKFIFYYLIILLSFLYIIEETQKPVYLPSLYTITVLYLRS
nr:MAG TPA: hypothetical protein [Caudoviricetes sp.]